jgi:hypothetical protein
MQYESNQSPSYVMLKIPIQFDFFSKIEPGNWRTMERPYNCLRRTIEGVVGFGTIQQDFAVRCTSLAFIWRGGSTPTVEPSIDDGADVASESTLDRLHRMTEPRF